MSKDTYEKYKNIIEKQKAENEDEIQTYIEYLEKIEKSNDEIMQNADFMCTQNQYAKRPRHKEKDRDKKPQNVENAQCEMINQNENTQTKCKNENMQYEHELYIQDNEHDENTMINETYERQVNEINDLYAPTHEYDIEYGIYEDIIQTEMMLAQLQAENIEYKQTQSVDNDEYNCPIDIEYFANVGKKGTNINADDAKEAQYSELYTVEQQAIESDIYKKCENTQLTVEQGYEKDINNNYASQKVIQDVYTSIPYEHKDILLPTEVDESSLNFDDEEYASYITSYDEYRHDSENVEAFSYQEGASPKTPLVQAVYLGSLSPVNALIQEVPYSIWNYAERGTINATFAKKYNVQLYIDNGATINIMPKYYYDKAKFLHQLPKASAKDQKIHTGNGYIQCHFWIDILLEVQGSLVQLKVLVCESAAPYGLLLSKMSLEQLQAWQDYNNNVIYIRQAARPLLACRTVTIPIKARVTIPARIHYSEKDAKNAKPISGKAVAWISTNENTKPLQPVVLTFHNDVTMITYKNTTNAPQTIISESVIGAFDIRSRDNSLTRFSWQYPTDEEDNIIYYGHTFASSLDPTKLANETEEQQKENHIETLSTPKPHIDKGENIESKDEYPWLDSDDKRRTMSDKEIMKDKIKLHNSILDQPEREEVIEDLMQYRDAFSLRDEIGTCPYFEVHLKLRDDTPFFVRPYNIREDQKPIIQKEMDRLERLGIIKKGLTGYSSPVLLVPRKQQNLYRVVTDFRVLNERLVRVNHAFPIVRDCLDAIGSSECEVMSVLDLRDAYHTLPLAEASQKYCGITPYYGASTYYYLRMGMGMSCSPALWQQFVHMIWEELPNKERYKIIMDDVLIFSKKEEHMQDLQNLFKVLIKYGLKISPHKCQLFRDTLVYMGLQFVIKDGKACYTPMKEKCEAIRALKPPSSVKECRQFCGMVNFLSTFLKDLRRLLIPIYDLTKKKNKFKWTHVQQQAFDQIKELLVSPPVLRMPKGNGFYRLESDTSRDATGGVLYQWQDNEWALIGYHSKRLPDAVRNYSVSELELTGLVCNVHGFQHLLKKNYFEVIIDHKAIEYMKRAKHQPTTTRLTTLLLKLNDYVFDIKYLEGSKLKVSDALSRLYAEERHKINDVIPLNFLQHLIDADIFHYYSHASKALYAHKTKKVLKNLKNNRRKKQLDTKPKSTRQKGKVKINDQTIISAKPSNLDITPITVTPNTLLKDQLVAAVNPLKDSTMVPYDRNITNHTIPDPLTLEKSQLEKRVVNTLRPVDNSLVGPKKYLIAPQDKLTVFRRHIPKQKDIDLLLANLRNRVLHNLQTNLDTKELIEAYAQSVRFRDIYAYIAFNKLPGNINHQKKVAGEAMNYVVVNDLLFQIARFREGHEWVYYLPLVVPDKFEANIINMYHNSLLAMHQGPYKTFLTMRKYFYFPNMLGKIKRFIEACALCLRTRPKPPGHRPFYGRIPENYVPCENLAVDIKYMPKGILGYKFLLIVTCERTNFVHAIPLKERTADVIAEALLHRVFCITGPPAKLSVDQDTALTGAVIQYLTTALECTMCVISPWNHGSSKAERQIQTIGNMINKHLVGKGNTWPLYAAISAYAMNTFASVALDGLSPFELVFVRKPRSLSSVTFPKLNAIDPKYREFYTLLYQKANQMRTMDMEWKTKQAQALRDKNRMLNNVEEFKTNDLVYLLAPHASSLQSGATKFRQDFIGPLVIDTKLDDTHYILKDPTGHLLTDTYHINRLKPAAELTPSGPITNYLELRKHMGISSDLQNKSFQGAPAQPIES